MAALRDSHGELEDAKEKPERTGEAMNHHESYESCQGLGFWPQ